MDILSDKYDHIYEYGKVNKTIIKILEATPCEGVDTYASVGKFLKTTNKEMLMLFYSNVDKKLYGAIASSVIDYFKENSEVNYYGGHTLPLGPIIKGSNITSFYLRPAYAFENEHIWEHYFWIVPITNKELEFLHKEGPNSLEDHLEENEVDILDLLREDSF